MFIMGCVWFLSSLGVYLRDIAPTIIVITNLMLFVSPVFYDLESVKDRKHFYLLLHFNPLTFIIQQMRRIFITQELPDFVGLLIYFVAATLFAWLGLLWFQKTRKGFADVL
jgi:lipopolysaccharide transport system permease protein